MKLSTTHVLVLLLVTIIGCERDFTNPYDPGNTWLTLVYSNQDPGGLNDLIFASDESFSVSCYGNRIINRNLSDGSLNWSFTPALYNVISCDLSSDGTTIVFGDDSTLNLMNASTAEIILSEPFRESWFEYVGFYSADEFLVAVAPERILTLDASSLQILDTIVVGNFINSGIWHGITVLPAHDNLIVFKRDLGTLCMYDLPSENELWSIELTSQYDEYNYPNIFVSEEEDYIVIDYRDGEMRSLAVLNSENGSVIWKDDSYRTWGYDISFHPTGKEFVTCLSKTLKVFETVSGSEIWSSTLEFEGWLGDLAYNADGSIMSAIGFHSETGQTGIDHLFLWETDSYSLTQDFLPEGTGSRLDMEIAWSPHNPNIIYIYTYTFGFHKYELLWLDT